MPFPYIFTFYSYKGGVGRSLALMNVAYRLAGWGRHVLVVDMDLEAPGLSSFMLRSGEVRPSETAHPKDILTLLDETANGLRGKGTLAERARHLPPVSEYIQRVADDRLATLAPRLGQVGRLDVLGTDLSRRYLDRLAELGLQNLFPDEITDFSRLLHHYFKSQVFPHRPPGVESFEEPIMTPYDYVLVDSRTGITEIGGLCVGPLADRLVVITGLNDQNVSGTLSFLKDAGIQPKPRPADGPKWDEADSASPDGSGSASLGPKPTIIVASPVPAGEITYKRQRLVELERLLGIRPVSLSYHPQMALMESIFVRDYPEEMLAGEYERLANALMVQVGDDAERLASSITNSWNRGKYRVAVSVLLRLAAHRPEIGGPILAQVSQIGVAGGAADVPEMRQLFAQVSHYPGTELQALNKWGVALTDAARRARGQASDRFFAVAIEKYGEILRRDPNEPQALNNWAAALLDQAKKKEGDQGHLLMEEARCKCIEALRLKPDYIEALINLGNVLSRQARNRDGEAGDLLFEEAVRTYAQAFQLKPDRYEVLNNWATAFIERARTKDHDYAHQLLNQARLLSLQSEQIRPGSGAYNLACIDAHEGNADEVVHWLEAARSGGQRLSQSLIADDQDFDRIRDRKAFTSFVRSLPLNDS